jgi:hypothetical protein
MKMVPADEIHSGIMYVHPATKETKNQTDPDNVSCVFVSIGEAYNLKLSFLSFLILFWFDNNFHFRKDPRPVTNNELPSG